MQYSFFSSCLLALTAVSSAFAQTPGFDVFSAPSTPGSTIKAGSIYTIKWTPSAPAGKVSIVLLEGSSNITLQVGPTIASGIDSVSGTYDWMVPDNGTVLPTYGLKIQLDSDPTIFQYSTYFSISGINPSGATVTVQVSSVSGAVATTTLIAQTITMNSTSAAASSTSVIFSNATVTTTLTTSTGSATTGSGSGSGTSTGTATGSSASATKSSGAVSSIVIGGTGLLGALMVSLGMLL